MRVNNTNNQDSQIKTDPLKSFKKEVCRWLRDNQLSVKWLASKIDRSEGTIRNWLYSSLTIPAKKQADIRRAMEAHINPPSDSLDAAGNIHFIALDSTGLSPEFNCWTTAWSIDKDFFSLQDMDSPQIAPSWVNPRSKYWENVSDIAKIITDILTGTAAGILHKSYTQIKTKDGSINNAVFDFFRGLNIENQIILLSKATAHARSADTEKCNWIFLPIVANEWNSRKIELAAAIENKSPHTWIVDVLNEAACKSCVRLFDDIENYIIRTAQTKQQTPEK